METTRQKKIAAVLQKDLTLVLQKLLKECNKSNILVSVTKVSVSPDLSNVKSYLSIFPVSQIEFVINLIQSHKSQIRNSIAILIRSQVRHIPEFSFCVDDSLEQISLIEEALKGVDDPIKKRNIKSSK